MEPVSTVSFRQACVSTIKEHAAVRGGRPAGNQRAWWGCTTTHFDTPPADCTPNQPPISTPHALRRRLCTLTGRTRFFYLSETNPTNVPADQLGTTLVTGSGNYGVFTWQISDALIPGRYTLGIAATDTGWSVAETVARGEEDRIIMFLDGPVLNVLAAAAEA